jgi:hypothetical protein
MSNIRLGDVRYNAQAGAFEARVDVISGGAVYGYPCQVPGPLNMDMKRVCAGLERHAMRLSVRGAGLMSHM